MPKIPNPREIGDVSVQNTRRVVDVPVDPTGQAVAQFGQAAAEVAGRIRDQQVKTQAAIADIEARERLAEAQKSYLTDTDWQTIPQRARADAQKVLEETGKKLRDPLAQRAWQMRSREMMLDFGARADDLSRRRGVDVAMGDIVTLRDMAIKARTDPTRDAGDAAKADQNFRERIAGARAAGFLDEARAQELLVTYDNTVRGERGKLALATYAARADEIAGTLATAPQRFDELVGGLAKEVEADGDLDPDAKVRLVSAARAGAAVSTVEALIAANPSQTLRLLRDEKAGGPFAALGDKRGDLVRSAQTEVDRRTAEWKGSIRDQISAIDDLIAAGKPLPNRLSVEAVRSALGDNVAAAYQSKLATYDAYQGLAMAPQADILRTIVDPKATPEQRRAAEFAAKQREDGTQFLIQRGVLPPGNIAVNLATAVQDQDPARRETALKGFLDELRPRVSRTMTLQSGLGVPAQVLTQQEAGLLSSALSPMKPVRERQQLLEQIRVAAGPAGFSAIMQQISGDKPLVAYAGNLSTVERRIGNLTGQTAAQAILRGENILASDLKASLPDKELETQWQSAVGTAYRGAASAEEQAKAAYRAAYASLAQDAGVLNGAMNKDLATQAIRIATGGIEEINKKKTVVPWGMPASVFMDSVKAGWPRITAMKGNEALRNARLQDVTFRAMGNGQYVIENIAREDGSLIIIRVDGAVVRPPPPPQAAPGVPRGGADE